MLETKRNIGRTRTIKRNLGKNLFEKDFLLEKANKAKMKKKTTRAEKVYQRDTKELMNGLTEEETIFMKDKELPEREERKRRPMTLSQSFTAYVFPALFAMFVLTSFFSLSFQEIFVKKPTDANKLMKQLNQQRVYVESISLGEIDSKYIQEKNGKYFISARGLEKFIDKTLLGSGESNFTVKELNNFDTGYYFVTDMKGKGIYAISKDKDIEGIKLERMEKDYGAGDYYSIGKKLKRVFYWFLGTILFLGGILLFSIKYESLFYE